MPLRWRVQLQNQSKAAETRGHNIRLLPSPVFAMTIVSSTFLFTPFSIDKLNFLQAKSFLLCHRASANATSLQSSAVGCFLNHLMEWCKCAFLLKLCAGVMPCF
jgi:hypothetical protein